MRAAGCANTEVYETGRSSMAVSETRVSRGRLLKRAGVGAAALGAGSMLTAAASQGAGAYNYCTNCTCGICSGQVACHNPFHPNIGGDCIPSTEGCCFCHMG